MSSVLEKIRALLAKAESAGKIGSQAEAELFAAKANELLLKHKIEMTDVERFAQEDEDPMGQEYCDAAEVDGIGHGSRLQWLEYLMGALCRGHFCEFRVLPGTRQYRVFGRDSDRAVVLYLFETLAATAERLSLAHYHEVHRRWRKEGGPKPFRAQRSFRLGFSSAIGDRLREMRKTTEREGGERALVIFNDAALAVKTYESRFESGGTSSRLVAEYDRRSHAAGYEAGRGANLPSGLGGGTAGSVPKQLGGGS